MNIRTKTCLYLAVIFCVGLLAGGVLGSALTKRYIMQPPRPKALAAQVERELTQKLDLDAAQQEKTRILVEESIGRIMAIYGETIQKIDTELLAAQKALAAELTPEQKVKLKNLPESRREFFRKHAPVTPGGM